MEENERLSLEVGINKKWRMVQILNIYWDQRPTPALPVSPDNSTTRLIIIINLHILLPLIAFTSIRKSTNTMDRLGMEGLL